MIAKIRCHWQPCFFGGIYLGMPSVKRCALAHVWSDVPGVWLAAICGENIGESFDTIEQAKAKVEAMLCITPREGKEEK